MKRRCGICREYYQREFFVWTDPHLETVHPKYWQWFKKWRITFFSGANGAIPLLILIDYITLTSHNGFLLLLANLVFIIWVEALFLRLPLRSRREKQRWKQDHDAG